MDNSMFSFLSLIAGKIAFKAYTHKIGGQSLQPRFQINCLLSWERILREGFSCNGLYRNALS